MILNKGQFRISITSFCNMQCVYCHNEGNMKKSVLKKEDIKKILDNSYGIGLSEIRLTGGDPLVNPEIFEICKMIKDDYNLLVSLNTNAILIDKLMNLINHNLIARVVVGLDYINANISKNSPIGVSSEQILKNILLIKNHDVDVSIATVFNNNYIDIENIVDWGIKNKIRVKIIEIEKNEISTSSSKEYLDMRDKILNEFNLTKVIDDIGEVNGYINDFKAVSFFHSLCRLRKCDVCKNIQCRITSDGIMKPCLYYCNQDENLLEGNTREKILKVINRKVDYHYDKDLIINEKK